MICEKCGQWIEEGSKTCSKCGAPVNVNNAQDANAAAGGYDANAGQGNQPPMTKKEFYKHPNVASVRSQIRSAGIICYVVAGISLIFAMSIIDAALILGLGLGIHLGRSRACAIILTVYGAFNTIVVSIEMGTLAGWWILLAGIYAIVYTFKYQSAWAEYLKTGYVKDLSQGKKK